MTTGTSTTCQCTPTSPKLEPHDVEELNLWHLHCKLTRTARACRCMSTGRTTSTTKGRQEARKLVHCPHRACTGQYIPGSDRNTLLVSVWTKRPSRDITQPGRVPGGICQRLVRSSRCQKHGRPSVMTWTQESSRSTASS